MKRLVWIQLILTILIAFFFVLAYIGVAIQNGIYGFIIYPHKGCTEVINEVISGMLYAFGLVFILIITTSILLLRKINKEKDNLK